MGYENNPCLSAGLDVVASWIPELEEESLLFHCVMRERYPVEAVQERIHWSSEWAGTEDWMKIVEREGERPMASRAASISRLCRERRERGWGTVMAWRSTTEKIRLVEAGEVSWRR